MDAASSPLNIPELLGECISYLHESVGDLAACAVVRRSWTYAAQSHLFKVIGIGLHKSREALDRRYARFLDIVAASPHILRFAMRLEVYPEALQPHTFSRPASSRLSLEYSAGIQQLLSLPRLGCVRLHGEFRAPGMFEHIWRRAAPGIKHWQPLVNSVPPPGSAMRGLQLESLTIGGYSAISRFLGAGPWVFDLSRLKALYVCLDDPFLRSSGFATLTPTLEVLEFVRGRGCVDLSLCTRLARLHIRCSRGSRSHEPYLPMIMDTLSTLPPDNRVQEIAVTSTALAQCGAQTQIEQHLATLRMPCLRRLEVCRRSAGQAEPGLESAALFVKFSYC
ncbi:hypothetical protein FB451DRAFT_1207727 [Mycena latifolia]|nr:hypothetical protein FB451DRAFT_1207727 [Mycena latifolia]